MRATHGSYLWARLMQFKNYNWNMEQLSEERWYIWNCNDQTPVMLLKTQHQTSSAGSSIIDVQHITIFKGSMIYLHSNTQHSQKGTMKSGRWKTDRIRSRGVTPRGREGSVGIASGNMNVSTKAALCFKRSGFDEMVKENQGLTEWVRWMTVWIPYICHVYII